MRAIVCLLMAWVLWWAPATGTAAVKVPSSSPFDYNLGCTYDSWMQSWMQTSIAYDRNKIVQAVGSDLDTLTGYFKMIHTYHDVAVGTNDLLIDAGMLGVLTYAKNHPDRGLQVYLATNEDTATPAKLGNLEYARNWVKTVLLDPMGGNVHQVQAVVKAIGIGNEIDAQAVFTDKQFGKAVGNLAQALREAGLGSIPITTTIANISHNPVAQKFVNALGEQWQDAWGPKFIFANNFPWMQGKGVETFKSWYEGAQAEYSSWELFVGETGYPYQSDPSRGFDKDYNFPKVSGGTGEYAWYTDMFAWLGGQYDSGHKTIPIFMFSAFDEPGKVPSVPGCSENHYGILGPDGKPKKDSKGDVISIPDWVRHQR